MRRTGRDIRRAAAAALLAAGLAACGTSRPDGPSAFGPQVVTPERPLQCVPFAREASGIQIRGDASTWWDQARGRYVRTDEPVEGSVMVMVVPTGRERGHLAVVREVMGPRDIVVDHANWLNDGRVYLNQPVRDVSPRNDWSAVRVWYAPGGTLGARSYPVRGFILPPGVAAITDGYKLNGS